MTNEAHDEDGGLDVPRIEKHTITSYLVTDCQRQLRINMATDTGPAPTERQSLGMPEKHPRPGLNNMAQAGDEWAANCLGVLDQALGANGLLGDRKPSASLARVEFRPQPLLQGLQGVRPGQVLAEQEYEIGQVFRAALQVDAQVTGISFARVRPDLLVVLAPGSEGEELTPDGSVKVIDPTDPRKQLRVVDIKLNEQPGPGYLAEVVYYSLALAAWLQEQGLDNDFLVRSDPSIWPGSHGGSQLTAALTSAQSAGASLTPDQALEALFEDLIVASPAVFVPRLREFFTVNVPEVMPQNWETLPFHVSRACQACDYLEGASNLPAAEAEKYCAKAAVATEHLSMIPFISRGATSVLRTASHATVSSVAACPVTDPVFSQHHGLSGQRTVVQYRAQTLTQGLAAGLAPQSGTSSVLPRSSNLSIYITANFDASTAYTVALGLSGVYFQGSERQDWKAQVYIVDAPSLGDEWNRLRQFLEDLDAMLQHVKDSDRRNGRQRNRRSSVQVYLWDDLTYRHLSRVVGRHLDSIIGLRNGIRLLAWLFPPEEVVGNAVLRKEPAISIVSDPVKSLIALPIPFNYSLLEVARNYASQRPDGTIDDFAVPDFYSIPLSDQIPSERAHDYWKKGKNSHQVPPRIDWTVKTQLRALRAVTMRLRADLSGQLRRWAPKVQDVAEPRRPTGATADENLWYSYAALSSAADQQDIARVRAMPIHEREARFESARLERQLSGQERQAALLVLGLPNQPQIEVYSVLPTSRDVKAHAGDFARAVIPEDQPEILDMTVGRFLDEAGLLLPASLVTSERTQMSQVLSVTVRELDRDAGLLAVEPNTYNGADRVRRELMRLGILQLAQGASLERTVIDIFTGRLKDTLHAIGRTPKAVDHPLSARATGQTSTARLKARVPVEDLIWTPVDLAALRVSRDVAGTKATLVRAGRDLDESQWAAYSHALTHRLSKIWGPPGTGKSRTLTRILAGAALDAEQDGVGLRILLTANTYDAIDNVMLGLAEFMPSLLPSCELWRIRSAHRNVLGATVNDCVIERGSPTQRTLTARLVGNTSDLTIVAATPHQVHKLAVAQGSAVEPLFDLIVVDEASQIDVATSLLSLSTMDENCSVIVAGDRLQLPPISKVLPPQGLESMVGSLYDFLHLQHPVPQQELLVNYRSNSEIIDVSRDAGYPQGLRAFTPDLRIGFATPVPSTAAAPVGWPTTLPWSPDLAAMLDPERPVVCVVHDDASSGQSNSDEADVVASVVHLLADRLTPPVSGTALPGAPYALDDLLKVGFGVVTPHRAQQSKITAHLQRLWPQADPSLIRKAVDTVEHFQGQQRDVIIGSYGVGDPDVIAGEDEFLQSLNRFNVMASRARGKLIVLLSRELVKHLSSDMAVLDGSAMLKSFAELRCSNRTAVSLGPLNGELRYP